MSSLSFFVINSCLHIHLYIHLHIPSHTYLCISLLCTSHSWASPFFSWTDESPDVEALGPKTKEDGDLETLRSWMEVGGFPARPEEEAWGASTRSELLFPSLLLGFHVAFYYFLFFSTPVLFHLSGAGFVVKHGCSLGRGPEVGDGSPMLGGLCLEKMEVAVAGSEVKSFMGSWGEQCHIPPCPQPHLLLRKSTTPHLPPSPTCPLRNPRNPKLLVLLNRDQNQPL